MPEEYPIVIEDEIVNKDEGYSILVTRRGVYLYNDKLDALTALPKYYRI